MLTSGRMNYPELPRKQNQELDNVDELRWIYVTFDDILSESPLKNSRIIFNVAKDAWLKGLWNTQATDENNRYLCEQYLKGRIKF